MFRGDTEAMRARIAVLERQLADARDEADRARVGEAELDQLRGEVALLREQLGEPGSADAKEVRREQPSSEGGSARAGAGPARREPSALEARIILAICLVLGAIVAYLNW